LFGSALNRADFRKAKIHKCALPHSEGMVAQKLGKIQHSERTVSAIQLTIAKTAKEETVRLLRHLPNIGKDFMMLRQLFGVVRNIW